MNTITRRSFFAIAAIIASLFFTNLSFAQEALPADLQAQVDAAVAAGDGDALVALANANTQYAAQIAQLAVQGANTQTGSNPSGAVALASAAVQIVSKPEVQQQVPAIAAQVAAAAVQVASAPAVQAAAPAAAAQIAVAAVQVAAVPAVAAAAPAVAAQVAVAAQAVTAAPAVAAAAPAAAAQVNVSATVIANNPAVIATAPEVAEQITAPVQPPVSDTTAPEPIDPSTVSNAT